MKTRVLIGGITFVVGFLAGCAAFAVCTFVPWYISARIIMDHIQQ